MKNRNSQIHSFYRSALTTLVLVFLVLSIGCAEQKPTSVTGDAQQSEIDAWKQRKAENEAALMEQEE